MWYFGEGSVCAPCMRWGEEFADDLMQISNSDSKMPLSPGAARFTGRCVWKMGCVRRVRAHVLLCALRLLKYVL